MSQVFIVHKESSADGHWAMKYLGKDGVVSRDRQAFYAARERVMLWMSPEFMEATGSLQAIEAGQHIAEIKKELLAAALTYASTLFSALNSLVGYLPKKREYYFSEIQVALGVVEGMPKKWLIASNREVLMACYQKLSPLLGLAFCESEAKKLGFEVLDDSSAPEASKLLARARLSQMKSLPHDVRYEHFKHVRMVLRRGMRNPTSIERIDQSWKTYVRLARMIRRWKPMFYGLKKDGFSLDLTVKSLMMFVGTFLTDQRKFWKGVPM